MTLGLCLHTVSLVEYENWVIVARTIETHVDIADGYLPRDPRDLVWKITGFLTRVFHSALSSVDQSVVLDYFYSRRMKSVRFPYVFSTVFAYVVK